MLADKYYVDEVYDAAIVRAGRRRVARPALARRRRRADRRLTRLLVQSKDDDAAVGSVPMGGWLRARSAGSDRSSSRDASGTYAWVLVVGVLAVLGAFILPLTAMRELSALHRLRQLDPARRC